MADDTKRLTVNVSADMHKTLKLIALQEDKTLSEVVIEFLQEKLKEREGK